MWNFWLSWKCCLHCLTWSIFMTQSKTCTAQKMKISIKDFFSKCDQIRSFLRSWSHLLKKSLTENFICCAVKITVWFHSKKSCSIRFESCSIADLELTNFVLMLPLISMLSGILQHFYTPWKSQKTWHFQGV